MKKFWRVFWFEYSRRVLTKRFLVTVIWMPTSIGLLVILMLVFMLIRVDASPVGYVDGSGLLADPVLDKSNGYVQSIWEYIPFESDASALAALEGGMIQAYYQIPPDYLESGQVRLVFFDPPEILVRSNFESFLTSQLLTDETPAARQRIVAGSLLTVVSADGSREFTRSNLFSSMVPLIAGALFIISLNNTGGFLLNALALERYNDTIEIIATSVSGPQLLAGKALGAMSAGLSQFAGIAILGAGGLLLKQLLFPELEVLNISGELVILLAGLFIPAFIMYAATLVTVGVIFEESVVALAFSILYLPMMIPFLLVDSISKNPNSLLAVGMSLFPLTAPLAMPIRYSYTLVPTWQSAVSVLILGVCAVGSIWAMGKVVRRSLFEPLIRWRRLLPWSRWIQKWRGKHGKN